MEGTSVAPILKARETGFSEKYGLGTEEVSIAPNIDPDFFEKERNHLFRHAWINVGRVEDVANPGDFIVQDIDVLNTSVIVVKGRDGQIRGFHNMCKHRGNKVVRTGIESGNCKGFSCGFHGWTYDLTGKLVIVPDEDQFFDVDKAKNGLTPIDLGVWEGFIFVAADPKESLKDFLGEVYDFFDGYFDNSRRLARYRADVKVNWKVVTDAFQEAYHAPFLHGKAYPDAITGVNNPLARILGGGVFGKHRMISIVGNMDHRASPVEEVLMKYAGTAFTAMSTIEMDVMSLPKGINPTKQLDWAFDGYIIFPQLLIAPMRVMDLVTYNFWPVAVDRTVWQTDHYMKAPENAGVRLAQEYSKVFARDVQREDLITLENTQSMLNSGALETMLLSDQEMCVRHSYKMVETYIEQNS